MVTRILISGMLVCGLLVAGCGQSNNVQQANTVSKVTVKHTSINDKVKVKNITKFAESEQYRKCDALGLSFDAINNTDKAMQGVQIGIIVKSQFGDTLRKLSCDIDNDIPAHSSVKKTFLWHTNQFIENEKKAVNTPQEKLKFEIVVRKIVYADGTMEK